jgi:hypothetical protein
VKDAVTPDSKETPADLDAEAKNLGNVDAPAVAGVTDVVAKR